jgi:hypothetical protein
MAEIAVAIGTGLAARAITTASNVALNEFLRGRNFTTIDLSCFNSPLQWESFLARLPQPNLQEMAGLQVSQIRLRTLTLIMQTAKTVRDATDGPARQNLIQVARGPKHPRMECNDRSVLKARDFNMISDAPYKTKNTWIINNKHVVNGQYMMYMVREIIIDCQAIGTIIPLVGYTAGLKGYVTTDSSTAKILELLMMRLYRQMVYALEAFRQAFLPTLPTLLSLREDKPDTERWTTAYGQLQVEFRTLQDQVLRAARGTAVTVVPARCSFPYFRSAARDNKTEMERYCDCIKGFCMVGVINKPNKIKKHLLWKAPTLVEVAKDVVILCLLKLLPSEEQANIVSFMNSADTVRKECLQAISVALAPRPIS